MNTRWQYFAGLGIICTALLSPVVSAQTPPASNRDDLDVTMRVIVDPDAKVPDEIVHRIPLPKPGQPASGTAPASGKKDDPGKPKDAGAKGQGQGSSARESGREFGQQTAEEARQRSEENRRNSKPDKPPGKPPAPPEPPRGRPDR
jgi:hypothetical protein